MHAPSHMVHTHACVTPSGAMDMDAPMHVTPMYNIFNGYANAPSAFVTCFWKNDYFGKYLQTIVIFNRKTLSFKKNRKLVSQDSSRTVQISLK